jgi:hypothetical protein
MNCARRVALLLLAICSSTLLPATTTAQIVDPITINDQSEYLTTSPPLPAVITAVTTDTRFDFINSFLSISCCVVQWRESLPIAKFLVSQPLL